MSLVTILDLILQVAWMTSENCPNLFLFFSFLDFQQPASVTYASLDPVDLQPDSSKMRDRSREETNYADIDLGKLQSDLV